MIEEIISYIREIVFGGSSEDGDGEYESKELDTENYSLYEIGMEMCRYHEVGIGDYKNETHFGNESMESVLSEKYEYVEEIPRGMVEDLDKLLSRSVTSFESRQSGGLARSKVETFRKCFFDQFTEEQVVDVIKRIYMDERTDFALERMFDEKETDGHVFNFSIAEPGRAQVTMEGEPMPIETTQVREKSMEMKKLAGQFDLCESPIIETIEDTIEAEAQMLWDELDVYDQKKLDDGYDIHDPTYDILDPVYESIMEIEDASYSPDVLVANGIEGALDNIPKVCGLEVVYDETGAMDVPFIVADSSRVGYRVTSNPLSVYRPRPTVDPYVYRIEWQGNYAVTAEDAVRGPS